MNFLLTYLSFFKFSCCACAFFLFYGTKRFILKEKYKIIKERKEKMLGVKDVDLKILQELNDIELGKVCSTNKAINNICKDESFWMNRTLNKFSVVLGNIEKIREYKEKSNLSWRNYYISLINFIDTLYSTSDHFSDRTEYLKNISEDKKIIDIFIHYNNVKISDCIQKYEDNYTSFCGTEWLDDPFVDLSQVFVWGSESLENKDLIILLDKLLEKYNFKLTYDTVFNIVNRLEDKGLQLVLKKRNLTYIPLKNLSIVVHEGMFKDLEIILKYMSKEDILYSLFSHFPDFLARQLTTILEEARKKGATQTDIIKGLMIVPNYRDYYGEGDEGRNWFVGSIEEVRRFLGVLSEEDKRLLKEVTVKRVMDIPMERESDVYFEIFKAI